MKLLVGIDPEVKKAMDTYKDVVGVPLTAQVHKALAAWLSEKGYYSEGTGKAAGVVPNARPSQRVQRKRKQ